MISMSVSKSFLSFLEQANRAHRGSFYNATRCPDKYVGRVKEVKNKKRFSANIDADEHKTPKSVSRVILLLESPHIKEFISEGSPKPACGYTGSRIRNCWSSVFGDAYDGHELVIMNAIQYQCSLGFSPLQKELRDQVFLSMFKGDVVKDLIDRIQSYKRSGDVLFSALTVGVKESVVKVVSKYIDAEVTHPASWRNEDKIKYAHKEFCRTLRAVQ